MLTRQAIAKGQGRVLLPLQPKEHVQDRGDRLIGDLQNIALEMTRATLLRVVAKYLDIVYAP